MGSKMSHDKRCSKPQVELFFRLFEAHHGGHLFVATKKWDERCACALMQKEMIIRLYNHIYADPAYWNDLGVEDRIFQLASAIAVVEPDAVFCGATAALLYGIGSAYSLLDKVQVLLPRSTRRDMYEFVEYRRWRPGDVWQLGPFTLTDPYRTVVDIARTSAFRYALGYVDGLAREYGVEREEFTRPGNAGYYLADYGWQMPNGSWMLAELHGLGKFEDDAQNDPEHTAAKTYRAAFMRDANLRAMGHNVIHFKLSDTYDVKAFGSMMRGYGIPTTKPYADS